MSDDPLPMVVPDPGPFAPYAPAGTWLRAAHDTADRCPAVAAAMLRMAATVDPAATAADRLAELDAEARRRRPR